jgi:beta-glucosidase
MRTSALRPYPTPEIDAHDRQRLLWARRTVAEMTTAEKIAQLHQYSPGVERLGIAPFVTGTEALHGVAWRGPSTQFPQPVGMAASWDLDLLRRVASVIASEVRTMHEADPRVSLSVWAPVVNPLRHPLWGRSEEALTEDPFLNAELACSLASGLRGSGETWRTLPTLKHFLAYSNETDRDATSSDLSPRVLHEYEMPGHLAPLVRGCAGSVMLSYNLVNGRPAHVTDLLQTELRDHLPDPDLLFVVSDAGAPSNLFRSQKFVADAPEAYAAMLHAGVDSFTDNDSDPSETISALGDALERGWIDESHLDRAVVRQLVARARTGEFDGVSGAEGDGDREDGKVAAPTRAAAHALARETATRSAVLLALNDHEALPLRPGRIAVIGEQAHSVLRDWYSGEFHEATSVADALTNSPGLYDLRASRALDLVSLSVCPHRPPGDAAQIALPDEVLLERDGALRCSRPAVHRTGPASSAPARFEVLEFDDDRVALREVSSGRFVTPDERGYLTATAERIGGWVVQEVFRRTIDDSGQWLLQHTGTGRFVGVEHHSGALVLRDHTPGSGIPCRIETHERGTDSFAAAVHGAHTVVLVIGNDPHVGGRETEDRQEVRLPGPMREAVERLVALPADVASVLLITSSYPYDLEGFEDEVGAVVWSSHAGEAEGLALTDLLAGNRDFSGRLAQTWPGSQPLPSVLDYDIISTSSTYLYGQDARFAFGHGLSIDRVQWSDAEITAEPDGLHIGVRLSAPSTRWTTGPIHDVVQIYADVPEQSFSRRHYSVPRSRLIGFAALEIPEDGSVTSRLLVPYERLALYAPDREGWELPDGPVTIRISRSSIDTVHSQDVHLPAEVLRSGQPPTASTDVIPAARAEETAHVARCATTVLSGTELRPRGSSAGWADFVLDAGTIVTALDVRVTGSGQDGVVGAEGQDLTVRSGRTAGDKADLIDPAVDDPASAAPLPLPHTVPSEEGRPTGRVRVRLVGHVALTGLRTASP